MSSVYCLADPDQVDAIYEGTRDGFIYARDGHPNAAELGQKMARLEGGEAGLVCSSGMGAIAAAFLALLSRGDHALVAQGVYGKTNALVTRQLVRWGINHDLFDPASAATAQALIRPATRLIFVETVSNPLLRVADLEALAGVARAARVPLIVDNTFAPLICRPIECGASLVVHSATKMIGGHSDLMLGILVGSNELIEQTAVLVTTLGQNGNPFESWLALRGLATLSLRFARASSTALALAKAFEAHPHVERVSYPGLPSHPDAALAKHLLGGSGGAMITIDVGSRDRAAHFIRNLSSIPFAPSLGDVQTTLSHPATTSHRGQDEALLTRQGITQGLIRLSIGLEDPDDLWREFHTALDALDAPTSVR
jgi:cystathionine beta-lyase/cystathionine gamma-synthase